MTVPQPSTPPESDEPGLGPTRPRDLLIIAVFVAVVSWILVRYNYSALPPLPLLAGIVLYVLAAIETATGRTAEKRMLPMQPGDVPATWADTTLLRALSGYAPQTTVEEGVAAYVDWFRDFYGTG